MIGSEFEYQMCSSILEGRPWALLHTTALQSGQMPTVPVDLHDAGAATPLVRPCGVGVRELDEPRIARIELGASLRIRVRLAGADEPIGRFWHEHSADRTALGELVAGRATTGKGGL